MKNQYLVGLMVMMAALVTGCATDKTAAVTEPQAIEQANTPFAQGAITLAIQTDPDLNALNGIANSCTLLVIQAEQVSTLNKLLSNPVMLKGVFSGAGAQGDILKIDRYAAMPGQSVTLHIDRSENTRYMAIVAGYYPFPQKQHMAAIAIPVQTEKTGWWWRRTWQAELQPAALSMRLGSQRISQFQGAKLVPITFMNNSAEAAPVSESEVIPESENKEG
ncbi:type VI secretion lipoprotein TssJ [Mangrovibacter yixingensis]|uniref:type VI secretion lipoprotein TssJ n=1 Tax=Mangrovibacter yixingensis TaxID=1529639 RepID=UPI001CFEC606|nr:type VI secretion lipoprotein TssJ [Mangrovibacter yixingensis]